MRIHTSLTQQEVYSSLPDGVHANIMRHNSRKRDHAYEVTLYVHTKDDLHRRFGNSGGYGAATDVAATWDEWGIWMANIYEKDPDAIIGWYESHSHFLDTTRHERDRVRQWNKPTSLQVRMKTAPWLEAS